LFSFASNLAILDSRSFFVLDLVFVLDLRFGLALRFVLALRFGLALRFVAIPYNE
jgi:hypothetical protein